MWKFSPVPLLASARQIPGYSIPWAPHTQPLTRLYENSGNTTHGSGWIVQVQPMLGRTRDSGVPPGIPPTAVGGLFRYSLTTGAHLGLLFSSHSLHALREERDNKSKSRGRPSCRPHLNDPPTAAGGIREAGEQPSSVGCA